MEFKTEVQTLNEIVKESQNEKENNDRSNNIANSSLDNVRIKLN